MMFAECATLDKSPLLVQVSFVQLLGAAFDDFTIKILCASGALSIGLDQVRALCNLSSSGW